MSAAVVASATAALGAAAIASSASPSSYKYVVIGGGNAAGYAAREFVQKGGGQGELAILSDEPYVSYERPALSKAYLFPEKPARLPGFHTTVGGGGDKQLPEWYEEHGIDFKTSTKVTGVDVKSKQLTTASGSTISYETLIVAIGSGVIDLRDFKTPGADLKGLFYLRNVEDADKLVEAMAATKAKDGKAVVVGGGYIGMEVAAALNMNGLPVTMVFPEDRLMARLFTPEIAEIFYKLYTDKGITIKSSNTVASFEGSNGTVTTTVLKSEDKLESDLVVVGVGAKPNIDLFKGQLELLDTRPGGIKVDSKLQSSDPSVYVVGDLAAFPQLRYGGTVTRQEHVVNARQSATAAIDNILSPADAKDYDYLPYFYSRIWDWGWVYYGDAGEGKPVFFGDKEGEGPLKFGTYWVQDGKVVAGFLANGSPDEQAAIKKVADSQPEAPSDLGSQGLAFASKL